MVHREYLPAVRVRDTTDMYETTYSAPHRSLA
jgi:hypothetical protein